MAYDFVAASVQSLNAGDVLDTSPNFTIVAIITPDDVTARHIIISKWNATAVQRSFIFEINSDGKLRCFVSTDGSFQPGNVANGSTVLSAGVTYRVEFNMDGTNTNMTLFLNGVQDGQNTSGPATVFSSTAIFLIGAQADGGAVEFDGDIGEVGHWNRSLNPRESAIYGSRFAPDFIPKGLDSYWPLIRDLNNRIEGVNLSLVNAPTVSSHFNTIRRATSQAILVPPAAFGAGTELFEIPNYMRGGFNPMHGGFSA